MEEARQSGATRKRAIRILRPPVVDVEDLTDRRVRVDLSYLGDDLLIERTKDIIFKIIKTHKNIPGEVEIFRDRVKGVFVVNVTNTILSPVSLTSESEESLPPKSLESKGNQAKVSFHLVDIIAKGVPLKVKLPGFPNKTISTKTKGFSEKQLKFIINSNPDINLSGLIKYILIKQGEWNMVNNFYELP